MFFRLLCQLDYQPFCCFVVGGKHLHLLVVIIIYSNSNIHLSSLISSFFQNLSSLYVPLSLFPKKLWFVCVFYKKRMRLTSLTSNCFNLIRISIRVKLISEDLH